VIVSNQAILTTHCQINYGQGQVLTPTFQFKRELCITSDFMPPLRDYLHGK